MVEASLVNFAELGVLLVGIVIALFQLQGIKETRQAELFMHIYETEKNHENSVRWFKLDSWEWEDLDDWHRKYGKGASPEIEALPYEQFSIYDGLGMLVKEKMVDVNTVFNMMGSGIVIIWYKFETIIRWNRETIGACFFEHFEYIANEMIKMKKQKGFPLPIADLHPTSTLHQELKT